MVFIWGHDHEIWRYQSGKQDWGLNCQNRIQISQVQNQSMKTLTCDEKNPHEKENEKRTYNILVGHCKFTTYSWKIHDDIIERKPFPRYWPFVPEIHQSPVHSPHKDQWCGALMFSLKCAWTNGYANNRDAGNFRCHCAHYDVTVMANLLNTLKIPNNAWIT